MPLNETEIVNKLKGICSNRQQKAFADKSGLSQSYICEVLSGKKGFGDDLARAMGYNRKVIYEKIRNPR